MNYSNPADNRTLNPQDYEVYIPGILLDVTAYKTGDQSLNNITAPP